MVATRTSKAATAAPPSAKGDNSAAKESKKDLDRRRINHIKSFRATTGRSLWELFTTVALQLVIWLTVDHLNTYALIGLNTLLSMRWFMIFHDAGHGSYCPPMWGKQTSALYHRLTSIVAITPLDWSYRHRLHHSHSGNYDSKAYGWNDTVFFTVNSFDKLGPVSKVAFRIFRNPLFFFMVGPAIIWGIVFRIPNKRARQDITYEPLYNTVGVVLYGWAIDHFFGWNALECSLWSAYFGGVLGFALFHGQHSFEDGYVRSGDEWSFQDAAIEGSSHIKIPRCFKWFTMGIEYHHIHHHDSKVPGYMLQECFESGAPEFWEGIHVINYSDWPSVLSTTLYDEEKQKFI